MQDLDLPGRLTIEYQAHTAQRSSVTRRVRAPGLIYNGTYQTPRRVAWSASPRCQCQNLAQESYAAKVLHFTGVCKFVAALMAGVVSA